MNNQYLTKNRKETYMKDFNNLILLKKDFWEIDNLELKQILIDINKNPEVQTLYSKYSNSSNPNDTLSYLTFTYSKKIELKIFRNLIPFFINYYNLSSSRLVSTCDYDFYIPQNNKNFAPNSQKLGIKCTDDINYFKINHIKINLKSENTKNHINFWNDLRVKFDDLIK